MENIYVRTTYLKMLHYIFFSFAVFSMTGGIMFFDLLTMESFIFLGLAAFYCASSMVVAYYYYRNYREVIDSIRIIKVYFVPYMVLALWTIGSMTVLVWFFPLLMSLIESFLFIDYYVFFVILTGFVLSRFRLVSRLFSAHSAFILGRAKKIAKEYACAVDVEEYSIRSSLGIDEILDDIWAHKDYPLPYVRKLEIAICEKHIIDINRAVDKAKNREDDETEKILIRNLESLKKDYFEKIKRVQRKVD